MKNHIAIKFVAVLLAALTLLTAVGSAVGIIVLAGSDLYSQSVEELYEDTTDSERRSFAVNLAHRYASLNLGNLPESYLNYYYGTYWLYDTFQYGYYFYTIRDEHGNIVESTATNDMGDVTRYDVTVTDIVYRRMVMDGLEDSAQTNSEATVPGELQPDETFPTTETFLQEPTAAISSSDETDDVAGMDTDTGSENQSIAVAAERTETYQDGYFDYEQDTYVELCYQYADLPPYTVELYLLPGALQEEPIWDVLRVLWQYRYDLFWSLGIGLLAFAALLVYLCCVAGKKPGQEEIKAGGLNCIPLDLYLGGGGLAVVLLVALALVGSRELLYWSSSPYLMLPLILFCGFAGCLIIVGFLFAFAAQVKMPDGYWWRNSVIGRCLRLLKMLLGLIPRAFRWLKVKLPPAGKSIFGWFNKIAAWLFATMKKCLLLLWTLLAKCLGWVGGKLNRFYSMLPMTWQWMLVGFLIITILLWAMSFRYNTGIQLTGIGLVLAIILYGATSFGILLEGAKRMSKGDLDSKVEDKLLLGSFKDFAGDLNALSDVAVVAAQKQMKAERMKTELITNVSHDIKTPLTSIINYVDLLEKPHSPEEQEQYLEVLSRQSLRLKKLIDDLMEMSKANTGNLTVEVTEVDAAEAINQALGEFADKLEKAQLTPVFRAPDAPIVMKADGRLAWRVLSNLLSNAVKYAMPGTRLYIDLMELEGKVVISLKNISRDELNVSADELLERFVRGDSSRNTEGSGLGLNIAQSLMQLQKGQLQLLVDGDLFKVTLVFPASN